GANLRLATSRELLRRGQNEEAFVELPELQAGVNREHAELRPYIRSLADLEPPLAPPTLGEGTRFSIRAHFDGSLLLVEHVLQIMLEGARNVRRHASADSAVITAVGEKVRISNKVDGTGLAAGATPT